MNSERIIARLDVETHAAALRQLPKAESVRMGTLVPVNVATREFGLVRLTFENWMWRHHKALGHAWRIHHAEVVNGVRMVRE